MANCIKCGKELAGTRVFCDECLDVMKEYPVPAGTPVNIPQRPGAKKAPVKKRTVTAEEQLPRLRRQILWLTGVLVVVSVVLGIALGILVRQWREPNLVAEETKGQNYSTQGTTPSGPQGTTPSGTR